MKNIDIDIDMVILENIDIDIDMDFLEYIDIDIDIDKGILQNINQSINQYIFRGVTPSITVLQSPFYIFFFGLVFFGVTVFVVIFKVCPHAQGARKSQEFSPWRYSCCSLSWRISKHIINIHR